MRLIEIETINFKHLGGSRGTLSLRLDEGVVGIRGPNESGKSSLMQAVFFALTGQPLEGGREKGHYVRYGANKALVRLRFEVGGREYLVERGIIRREKDKPEGGTTSADLYEIRDGTRRVKVVSGVREVNDFISKFLGGLGPEELRSTIFIIQKDLDRLKKEGAEDRKKLIDSLIGRESFDGAKEKLDSMRKDLEGTPKEKGRIEKARENLNELEEKLEEYRKLSKDLKEVEKEISILNGPKEAKGSIKEQESLLREVEEKLGMLEEHQKERGQLEEKIRECEARIKGLEGEIDTLKYKNEELKEAERELNSVEEGIKKLEGPEEVEGSINWLNREKKRESSMLELLRKLRDLANDLMTKRSDLERVLSNLGEVEGEIGKRKELLEKEDDNVKRLTKEKEDLEVRIKDAEVKEKRSRYVIAGLLLMGGLLIAAQPMPGFLLLLLGLALYFSWGSNLSKNVTELKKDREACINELKAKNEIIKKYKEELESLEKKKPELTKNLEELEKDANNLEESIKDGLSKLKSESKGEVILRIEDIHQPENLIKQLEKLTKDWNERVMKLSDQISRAEERLKSLDERKEKLKNKIEELRKVPGLITEKKQELEEEKMKKQELEEELSGLDQKLPEDLRPFEPEKVDEYRKKKEEAYGELQRRKEKLRNLEDMEKNLKDKIKIKELERIEEKVEEAKKELEVLEKQNIIVKKALEMIDKAAKATRDAVRPAIEYGMSTILPVITQGRYGRVRISEDTFDVEVYDSDAGDYVKLERFSGGTVDQVYLSMRLAFTLSVIPRMKGQHPEFLFMDEVLASSDSDRRKNIMEMVTTNLKKHFTQIVVISHQEDVLRYADRHVVMSDGEARIV